MALRVPRKEPVRFRKIPGPIGSIKRIPDLPCLELHPHNPLPPSAERHYDLFSESYRERHLEDLMFELARYTPLPDDDLNDYDYEEPADAAETNDKDTTPSELKPNEQLAPSLSRSQGGHNVATEMLGNATSFHLEGTVLAMSHKPNHRSSQATNSVIRPLTQPPPQTTTQTIAAPHLSTTLSAFDPN
ncbi:hypothetical protein HK102_000506 [Quaeritorhiza haematococci]|nr:hypothetical protein HK102_000506 [Quaeritorhiza haematococci]